MRSTRQIIAGDHKGYLLRCSGEDLDDVRQIPVFNDSPIERLMSDDHAEFAVAFNSRDDLAVVDLRNETVITTLSERAASAVSPDGRWVASARHGHDDVEVFARENMHSVAMLPAHSFHRRTSFVLPGWKVSGHDQSPDRTITVWSCETWQLLYKLSGHQSHVLSADVLSDGRTLATGDSTGLIKLWIFPADENYWNSISPSPRSMVCSSRPMEKIWWHGMPKAKS